MPVISLSDLKTRILRRCDMENSSFIGATELTDFINSSIGGLIDILVEADDNHSLESFTFTTGKDNLLKYSESFDTSAYWSVNELAFDNNLFNNHLNNQSGFALVPSAALDTHYIQATDTIVDGETYTFSIYAKKGSGSDWIHLSFDNGFASFDLNTGSVGQVDAQMNRSFIEAVGGGWFRIGFSFVATSMLVSNQARIRVLCATSTSNSTLSGDASTIWSHIFGAQLTQKDGFEDYIKTTASQITNQRSDRYSLPVNCYHLKGVDYIYSSTESQTLLPFNFNDRNKYKSPYSNISTSSNIVNYHYRWMGNNLLLTPEPENNLTFQVWYYPKPTTLSDAGDSLNFHNRYEEWIIIDAAIKCLLKEESSVTALTKEREKVEERITTAISRRDLAFSDTVGDVTSMNDNWDDLY